MYGCDGLGAHMVDTIILPDGTPITVPALHLDTPAITGRPEPVFTTRFGQPYTMEEIVVTADKPKIAFAGLARTPLLIAGLAAAAIVFSLTSKPGGR